jgi:hypothetical protein
MAMDQLDEIQTARVALDEAWRQLAPVVDEAKSLQHQAELDPAMLSDRWVQATSRWLTAFQRQLGAVQTVHDAAEAGKRVPVSEIRSAREAAEKLSEIYSDLAQQMRQPA